MVAHQHTAQDDRQDQQHDTQHRTQRQIFSEYLKSHTATASMVSDATGVPQKNLCRYKRDLEKSGLLWQVKQGLCKVTGYMAWYLTTNPALIPARQPDLFSQTEEGGSHE